MKNVEELENEGNSEIFQKIKKDIKEKSSSMIEKEKLAQERIAHRHGLPWLSLDNPAIWSTYMGDED